jgi:hypothetical protein
MPDQTTGRPTDDELRQIAEDPWVSYAPETPRHMAIELLELRAIVADFINERPEYVNSCRNAHPDNYSDYHRWQGGAEARRQLAERLGWTVPYEFGDKTAPKVVAVTMPDGQARS